MGVKIITGMTVALMALSAPSFADSSHHQGSVSQSTMQSSGMGMMDMKKMHDHMRNMQETMKNIHATEDKDEQKKLMKQHMQEMRKGMRMMSAGKHGGMSKMKGKHNGMENDETIKDCHGMMSQRMAMMQSMMSQMMEHMSQQQSMRMDN